MQNLLFDVSSKRTTIARNILRAHEEERNHIGRELHDNVNQVLAGACIYLQRAAMERPDLIGYPMELLQRAIQEIRSLSSRYVMPVKNSNLEELVRDLLNHASVGVGFTTELVFAAPELQDDELKLHVYRIIQEQVNNIIKYAGARRVAVMITSTESELYVMVSDDGAGFDPSVKRNGIGISNMYSRVETYHGQMEVASAPGEGCVLKIVIPMARSSAGYRTKSMSRRKISKELCV